MTRLMPRGMKIGAVSLWLLLLLSEKPMYGYEIIRELEKRFSGYWKPQTGTIYPALEKLEVNSLVTSRIEFKGEVSDRKHYALTEEGKGELSRTMAYWTKMTEILENYRETHESIFRYKSETDTAALAELFDKISRSLRERKPIEISKALSTSDAKKQSAMINPTNPLTLKFLYAKENHKMEFHLEVEWIPRKA